MNNETKPEKRIENHLSELDLSKLAKIWEERAVLIIQRYFRKLNKFGNSRDINMIGNDENIIMNCGRIVSGKSITLKMFYLEETNCLRILLFDKETKRTQTFLLDNVKFLEVNHNELVESAWKIVEKIEYDKVTHQFFIGLEQSKNKELNISVLSLPKKHFQGLKRSMSVLNMDNLSGYEIYNGLKKTVSGYYNVKISINNEGKGEIFVMSEKDSLRQRIEITTNLSEYLKLYPKEKVKTKLGRMIYNEISSVKKGIVLFNEEMFRREMFMTIFKERNEKLKKVQRKYKSYFIKKNLILMVTKATTERTLIKKLSFKIGTHYHLIKIFEEKNRPGIYIIKSDRATNELKIKMDKIGFNENDDISNIKDQLKKRLSEYIAYDPVKMHLIFYNKKERMPMCDNESLF